MAGRDPEIISVKPLGKYGCQLELRKGDITREDAAIIVNAANAQFMHGSGVAGAIVEIGGFSIQDESTKLVQYQKNIGKPFKEGDVGITGPGGLRCKMLFHAVGPIWQDGHSHEEKHLKQCIHTCLKYTDQFNLESIAFPPISSGIFGYPKEKVAKAFKDEIEHYIHKHSHCSLKSIRITVIDDATLKVFQQEIFTH
eukprot:TRINITY_DN67954_c5_g9_i2.p1 TRINITY_DN67954_c5_g9~~TRINITY_DN67954_c5_g9_i2.p1  ORF type:complete len:197 (-),score=16.21 TRINITY_DN67954_c5_g9_i2:316-906(-)